MTHSQVAAIEAREQRIAHLERRLVERENAVSLMADELAFMATTVVRLREDNAAIRLRVRLSRRYMWAQEGECGSAGCDGCEHGGAG